MTDRWCRRAAGVLLVLVALLVTALTPVEAAPAGEPSVGTVRGRVTAAVTGDALAGVCVVFVRETFRGYQQLAAVETGADGSYEALVPVASAIVVFEPGSDAGYGCHPHERIEGHVGEFYDDVTNPFEATEVDVADSQIVEGIDAALSVPSHITGTVTADDGGAPLEGICVGARDDLGSGWAGTATTDADGNYDIATLVAGDYRVGFHDCTPPIDHVGEGYVDLVEVGAASTTSDIDAALATAGHIRGRVTDDATGRAVIGGRVDAGGEAGSYQFTEGSYQLTETTADGTYDIGGLAPGSYQVRFSDHRGRYAGELYDDVPSGTGGDLVVVAPAATVSGVDAGLRPACRAMPATVDLRLGESPTSRRDVIRGTARADVITGLDGDDLLCGMGGADQIRGGLGVDEIYGDDGADDLRGGWGFDWLHGGPGDDRLAGGAGRDILEGDEGTDDCRGGPGYFDVAFCEAASGIP